MTETTRSALIFEARNLGRAIIETLVAQGWNVAGAARSEETLANVTAAGALAPRSDITDQAAVRDRRRGCGGARRHGPRRERGGGVWRHANRPVRRRPDRRRR